MHHLPHVPTVITIFQGKKDTTGATCNSKSENPVPSQTSSNMTKLSSHKSKRVQTWRVPRRRRKSACAVVTGSFAGGSREGLQRGRQTQFTFSEY